MAVVGPWHRYSNEAKRADIYDDFKFVKKHFGLHGFYKNISVW